jgi:hypothetical protein
LCDLERLDDLEADLFEDLSAYGDFGVFAGLDASAGEGPVLGAVVVAGSGLDSFADSRPVGSAAR